MKKINNIKIENEKAIDIVVNIIFGAIILLGIIASINMLLVKRSLWLDEAAFAYSFSQRNIINLTFGAFDWEQIGPIIYLYIVKIITVLFGNNEVTLRIFSLISYILLLILTYLISKNIFKNKYPIIPTAFIASMKFILKYSNEFKPYMFDAVVCLFVIYMYYLYKEKKINLKILIVLFMISIWASNPSCFFIGGILLYEFIVAIKEKNTKQIKNIIIGGVGIFVSFVIYYIFWLNQVATSTGMQDFWVDYSFPIIPTSISDLERIFNLIDRLIMVFDNYGAFILLLSGISIIIGIYKKNKYNIIILLSSVLALFASSIGKYPFNDRLWMFIYPIIALLAFDVFNKLLSKSILKNIIVLFVSVILVLSNTGIILYLNKENVYYYRCETNTVMEYIEENIKENEKIYISNEEIPNFGYKYGYATKTFGEYENEVIFPRKTGMFLDDMTDSIDYDLIKDEDGIYIVLQNVGLHIDKNMYKLAKNGYLELMIKPYDTPLYYYTKDIKNMKTKVQYIVKKAKIQDGKYILVFSIKNIGDTIINNRYEDICISSKQDLLIHKNLEKELQKGEEYDIMLNINFNELEEMDLQLYCDNGYWFDEFGIEPLKITKSMFKMEEI